MLFLLLLSFITFVNSHGDCNNICNYQDYKNISLQLTEFNGNIRKYEYIIPQNIYNKQLILELNKNDCDFYCSERNDLLFIDNNIYYKINNLQVYVEPVKTSTTSTTSITTTTSTTSTITTTSTTSTITTTTSTTSTTTTTSTTSTTTTTSV